MPLGSSGIVSNAEVFVWAEASPADVPILGEVFETLDGPVLDYGPVTGHRGTLEGGFREGHGLTGVQWATRFANLIDRQHEYRSVWLITPHFFYTNVRVPPGSYQLDPILERIEFGVTIPYLALS